MKPSFKYSIDKPFIEDKVQVAPAINITKVTEFQLWQEFKLGSEAAFATIYNDNVANLYRYGLSLVQDEVLVKESIQDFFVELWNSRNKVSDIKSIKPYLFKSIRRKVISKASSKRKNQTFIKNIDSTDNTIPSYEISLVEKQRFNEDRNKLKKALINLNTKQQEIIHLKFYCQLSYKEISEVMSIDKKGVYNLIAYTLKQLRQHLGIFALISTLFFHN